MKERPRFALENNEDRERKGARKDAASDRVVRKPRKREAALRRFTAEIQVTATQMVRVDVEAKAKGEARKIIEAQLANVRIDPDRADVKHTIKRVLSES